MIDLKDINNSAIEQVMYDLVYSTMPLEEVAITGFSTKPIFIGTRNKVINLDTEIYCNAPIEIKDQSAMAYTIVRFEIWNKLYNGFEQQTTTTNSDGSVLRYGDVELYNMIVEIFGESISSGRYHFDYKGNAKVKDDDYSVQLINFYCKIT